ncbi:murein biosynthesis integral membrane protein MurJ [Candidatus Parcubacteria bacterium]|nr:murein biosynthesis integral membrane protein MurJ [Candidatus Parcubacteria bacterium]
MVKKFLTLLYKETSTLHQAAYLLGFFALLSQVLAFLRDRLLAHVFGAGSELDTYYAAFRIPDFLFVTVASIVSLSVIVPFIVEREEEGREAVKEFINDIFSFFSFLIIIVCGLAYFLIPVFSPILFKGLSGEALSQVILLSRILLLSPIFLGFSNLFGSLTQAYNRFLVYAFAPVVYNAGIILGVLILVPKFGVMGVAWGVALGALLHALIQIPYVIKMGLMPRFKAFFDFASIRRVVLLSFPRTLTLSINHISTIFLVSLASLMAVGSISIYSFSFNISSVPLSIIGVSYSLAVFPTLSRYFSQKNIQGFIEQMATTTRHIIFWSLPVTALFIVLRAQIVRVLLGTGRFNWDDTRLTAAALAIFSVSALFQSLLLLFIRAFYSAGQTRKPLLINLASTGILIACTYFFVKVFYSFEGFRYFITALLKVDDLSGSAAVLMLPLGYSVGTIINGVVHWIGFEREYGGFSKSVKRTLFECSSASVVMGYASHIALTLFAPLFNLNTLPGIFLQGLVAGMVGIVIGILVLRLLGSRELAESWRAVHAKFWKAKVIAQNPEIV